MRSGNWIARRRIGPMPYDWLDSRLASRIPLAIRHRTGAQLMRRWAGDPASVGLPPGPERAFTKPPALSDGFFPAVRDGRLGVSAEVVELLGDKLRTADDEVLPAQALLWGTGYAMDFGFLPNDVPAPTMQWPGLYRGVVSPHAPDLAFVGAVAGVGAQLPLLEAQAEWLAAALAGQRPLPSVEVMREAITRDQAVARRERDPHCGYLVDRVAYIRALERETERASAPAAATTR